MSRKLTQQEFDIKRKNVHKEKYECLDDYVNMNISLRFLCKIHGVFKQKPSSHINQKQGCPCCKYNCVKNLEWVHALAKLHEGECLTSVYKGANTLYNWKCKNEHQWEAIASNVAQGDWCKICGHKKTQEKRKLQNGLERLINIAYNNNGKCLSEKYINSSTKYKWECKNNHIWKAYYPLVEKGSWCPRCKESKGERILSNILDKLCIQYLRQYTFPDCKYKYVLRFDFYLPKYNCLIEFDGAQHFVKSIKKWKKVDYDIIRKRDQIKNEYCHHNDIKLLRIPYNMINHIGNIIQTLYSNEFIDPVNYSQVLLDTE